MEGRTPRSWGRKRRGTEGLDSRNSPKGSVLPLPQAHFHPSLPQDSCPRPPTPFPLLQRRLFEKKQRRKRQEPLMVQANPDASLWSRRPHLHSQHLSGYSGEERFLGSGGIVGLKGGALW